MMDEIKKDRAKTMLPLSKLLDKKNWLFLVGICGIFLIFLSDTFMKRNEEQQPQTTLHYEQESATEYCKELESRLAELLLQVEGAGKVKLVITLAHTGETLYALDETQKTDTKGMGESLQYQSENQAKHVILDTDEPLIETQLVPEIQGVAIVCEGGDDITVIKRITELVSVVLGVSTNRVCVTKMM